MGNTDRRNGNGIGGHSLRTRAGLLVLVSLGASLPCLASEGGGIETGETLSLFSPARPAALSAFTAVGCGVSGMGYNPAALASQKTPALSGTYLDWVEDSRVGELRLALPGPAGTLGLSVGAFQAGDIEVEEDEGIVDRVSAQDDYVVSAGFGGGLPMGFSLGGTVKWYQSTLLSEFRDATVLADAGMMWRSAGEFLGLGVALKNVGRGLKYLDTRVPFHSVLTAGFAVRPLPLAGLMAVGDVSVSRDEEKSYSGGVELELLRTLAIRCGGLSSEYYRALSGGVGLKYKKFQFDYALVIPKDLSSTSRASLTVWM